MLKQLRFPSSISMPMLLSARMAVGLFFIAFIPRFLWALVPHPQPFSDMKDYYLCAAHFLKGSYLAMSPDRLAYWPPLYPLFLAGCIDLFPNHAFLAVRLVQSVLSSLSAVLLFFLTQTILNSTTKEKGVISWVRAYAIPLGAGLTLALFADHIFFASLLMTESLFVFLLLVWTLMAVRLKPSAKIGALFFFSFLLGVLILIRPSAFFFLPILVFKVLQCAPPVRRKVSVGLTLFAWGLPILPWTIRNAFLLHAFVWVSSNSGVNFYLGHNPNYDYDSNANKEGIRILLKQRGYDEVQEDRYFLRLGVDYLLHYPFSLIPHSLMKLYYLYILTLEPWPWESYNGGGGLVFYGDLRWPTLGWNPFFLFMSLAGITYAAIRRLNHGLILALIGLHTLSCLVFFANTRFRIPIEPFLLLYSWIGIASLVDSGRWIYGVRFNRNQRIEPSSSTEP